LARIGLHGERKKNNELTFLVVPPTPLPTHLQKRGSSSSYHMMKSLVDHVNSQKGQKSLKWPIKTTNFTGAALRLIEIVRNHPRG
jgi:hypothetical protein